MGWTHKTGKGLYRVARVMKKGPSTSSPKSRACGASSRRLGPCGVREFEANRKLHRAHDTLIRCSTALRLDSEAPESITLSMPGPVSCATNASGRWASNIIGALPGRETFPPPQATKVQIFIGCCPGQLDVAGYLLGQAHRAGSARLRPGFCLSSGIVVELLHLTHDQRSVITRSLYRVHTLLAVAQI